MQKEAYGVPEDSFSSHSKEAYTLSRMEIPGYEKLAGVLRRAYAQAAAGKGKERHAGSRPYHEQPMQQVSQLLGSERGMAFQAIKKIREGLGLSGVDRKVSEILGAINYLAGIVIYLEGAEERSPPALFRHHRTQKIYELVTTASREDGQGKVVVYRGEDGRVWTRPEEEFFGQVVEVDSRGGTSVPRFQPIGFFADDCKIEGEQGR